MKTLIKRNLSFTEIFNGFKIKVEFVADPKTNTPQSNYDYEVNFLAATTAIESVDIHLLARGIESINIKISEAITSRVHNLYMVEEIAHQKWLRNYRASEGCEHSDLAQANC
jgi:hypothetical protein